MSGDVRAAEYVLGLLDETARAVVIVLDREATLESLLHDPVAKAPMSATMPAARRSLCITYAQS